MTKDFTHSKVAPVLVCFVMCYGKFLLLKRGEKVLAYKNLWSTVAGFLDDEQSEEDKIKEELRQELGVEESRIQKIVKGPVYTFDDAELGRSWIRHLYLVEITSDEVQLDWEHEEYRWVIPSEINNFKTTPGLADDLAKVNDSKL